MPAAGAIIVGAAFSGFSAAAFAGFSLAAFAGSLVLGGLSYALTPKPKKPNFDAGLLNKGQTVAVRQSDLTRQNLYGHTRITRGYAHMESTGLNGTLHQIVILCEGPVRSINEIWINDYVIPPDWIDSEGNITQGRYAGHMRIRKHLGAVNQTADPLAVANMPLWTNDHRLQGTAYLYIIMYKDQDVYPIGVPNVTAIVEGQSVYDPRIDASRWSPNIALQANDFITSDLYGFGAFPDEVDQVNIAAQANICDEIVATEPQALDCLSINTTTNILTLSGDTLLFQFGDQVRVSGDSIPSGLAADTDYYVIPYQVQTTPRILLAASLEDSLEKVAIDITTTGSNVVITKVGEPRYHGGGVVDSETPLSDTLNSIVNCMAGRAVNVGGFWTLLAGAWRTPAITFTIDDLRGNGFAVKNAQSMGESYNVVKGLFVSSLNNYQNTDYPSAVYQSFIEEDGGLEAPKDINLTYTNRPTTAQRIAKIELFKGRQGIVFNSSFSTKGLMVKPGDTVFLDVERLGWDQKPFEVTEFNFDVSNQELITRMTLRETAQAIFDWTSGEAIDYDPAPNTNLTNPFDVQAVAGTSYNSRFVETRNGDSIFVMSLEWDQHPDAFVVEFGDFEIQYKLSSDIEWLPSFFVDGSLTKTDVLTASINTFYDMRIRARNNLGVRSGWTTIIGAVVGSSGGVTDTRDYHTVVDPVVYTYDYGSVADPHTSEEDWGFVV